MSDHNDIDGVYEVPTSSGPIKLRSIVTNRVKALYESWLAAMPRRRVFDQHKEGFLNDREFKEALQSVDASDAAGTFSWGGDAWLASLQQLPGIVKMVTLLADVDEDRVLDVVTDDASFVALKQAVATVVKSTPNFLSPPKRGKTE